MIWSHLSMAQTQDTRLRPALLLKLPLLQYLEGMRSMCQTTKQIQINTIYRWFLGCLSAV
ncbi:transposase [Lactococcus ileimucosae]|uniref:transposase n=2 Tax=Lactococcus ileimucosae TaxID=2941329 RepID=UPI0035119AF2